MFTEKWCNDNGRETALVHKVGIVLLERDESWSELDRDHLDWACRKVSVNGIVCRFPALFVLATTCCPPFRSLVNIPVETIQ